MPDCYETYDTPFGPDYIWENQQEYETAVRRMSLTPYQMAREFRKTFGQPLDSTPTGFADISDHMSMDLVDEESSEVREAWLYEFRDGPEALLKELADLVYVVYGYAAFRGWNLDKAVSRVHLSNMSKVGPDGEVIRREDGKVLKGPNYRPPYLKDLI